MINLSIIILNYNTKDLTIQCLESLAKQYSEQLKSGEFEVIVVDNSSTDDSVSSIKKKVLSIKNVKLIENKENVGFSKGNNIGAENARGKYLFFLNSDTEVEDQGLIKMVEFMEQNEKVGVLGARLKNIDGTNQKSVGKFYNLQNVSLMLMGAERLGMLRFSPNKILKADWVMGAAMMARSDLFKKIGGFDEKMFMYMEDVELCFRIKKSGFNIYFYPDINIVHKERGSSNKTFAVTNIYKGLLYFYKKHGNFLSYNYVRSLLYSKAVLALAIGTVTRNNYLIATYRKAIGL